MKGIVKNWNIVRVLRLVIAIAAIVQSVVLNEVVLGVVGAGLLLFSVLNVGCCGVRGCSIEAVKEKKILLISKLSGMKKWVRKNNRILVGTLTGALVGFLYWAFIGCNSGSCAITSDPLNSTLYFSILGALALSMFQTTDAGNTENKF